MATLVLSSVLLLAASASAPPDAYLAARAQLVASADALRFDAAAVSAGLSHKEQLVNASLMALKQAARNASTFLPALPFHSAKAAIGATALFAKLAVLPKGGVLHLHWDSALSTAWAINATYQEGGSDDGDGNGDVAVMFVGGGDAAASAASAAANANANANAASSSSSSSSSSASSASSSSAASSSSSSSYRAGGLGAARYNDMRFVQGGSAPALAAARAAGWLPMAELRAAYGGGAAAFDAAVASNLTMGEGDFDPSGSPWAKFQGYFGAVAGVLLYRPVYERYLADLCDSFWVGGGAGGEQRVQYAELRFATGGLYDFTPAAAAYSGVDMARLVAEAASASAARSGGRFFGARLIPSGFRGADAAGTAADVAATVAMQAAHPGTVVGFDLVGQEDGGWDLLHHASALLGAEAAVAAAGNNGSFGLYLHVGETSWGGRGAAGCTDTDDDPGGGGGGGGGGSSVCSAATGAAARNLFDASLLARRLGHALALPKFPSLMRRVADDASKRAGGGQGGGGGGGQGGGTAGTPAAAPPTTTTPAAVEVCPISNQVLNYVSDLRDHPATAMLAAGVPITLSPDDPAPLGYSSVTYDWWLAFVAWELDLAGLKQLALNSIDHSALPPHERAQLKAMWAREWAAFVDEYVADM